MEIGKGDGGGGGGVKDVREDGRCLRARRRSHGGLCECTQPTSRKPSLPRAGNTRSDLLSPAQHLTPSAQHELRHCSQLDRGSVNGPN